MVRGSDGDMPANGPWLTAHGPQLTAPGSRLPARLITPGSRHSARHLIILPLRRLTPTDRNPVPKRNYGFEKRQKELAKVKKREAKQARRAERAAAPPESPEPPDPTVSSPPEPPAD